MGFSKIEKSITPRKNVQIGVCHLTLSTVYYNLLNFFHVKQYEPLVIGQVPQKPQPKP